MSARESAQPDPRPKTSRPMSIGEVRPERVALVHDCSSPCAAANACSTRCASSFPRRPYTPWCASPGIATPRIEAMKHVSSRAGRLPGVSKKHRWLLPLYPSAIEALDISEFDLVVSSSHCVAKGSFPAGRRACLLLPHAGALCLGSHRGLPARQLDFAAVGPAGDGAAASGCATGTCALLAASFLRRQQRQYGQQVSNSSMVATPWSCRLLPIAPSSPRIWRRLWTKSAMYSALGGMVPYKRVDLAVAAYALMPERKLVI